MMVQESPSAFSTGTQFVWSAIAASGFLLIVLSMGGKRQHYLITVHDYCTIHFRSFELDAHSCMYL